MMSALRLPLLAVLVSGAFCGCRMGQSPQAGLADTQPTPGISLRGLHPVSCDVAWASGQNGTVLRTVDGGRTWDRHRVAGAEGVDFRDIEAFSAESAVAMGITEPAVLYRTDDGGASWQKVFEHADTSAFLDTIAFDGERGVAFGDPIDGAFLWLATADGGRTWTPGHGLPTPLEGEGGFAASGSLIAISGNAIAIATSRHGRVLHTADGSSWQIAQPPIQRGSEGAGIFSLWRRDHHALAVGGDYKNPESTTNCGAWSSDGGRNWQPTEGLGGYRSSVVVAPGGHIAVACGPGGVDRSRDLGRTWEPWLEEGFHVAAFAPDGSLWAAGSDGRVRRLDLDR